MPWNTRLDYDCRVSEVWAKRIDLIEINNKFKAWSSIITFFVSEKLYKPNAKKYN